MMKETHVYVGRKPCGCVVAFHLDCADATTAHYVDQMKSDGLDVRRLPREEARGTRLGCSHNEAEMWRSAAVLREWMVGPEGVKHIADVPDAVWAPFVAALDGRTADGGDDARAGRDAAGEHG
jgi:hypothetical protein